VPTNGRRSYRIRLVFNGWDLRYFACKCHRHRKKEFECAAEIRALRRSDAHNKLINISSHISIKYCLEPNQKMANSAQSLRLSPFVCCPLCRRVFTVFHFPFPNGQKPPSTQINPPHSHGPSVPPIVGIFKCLSHEFILLDFDLKVFRLHNLGIFITFQHCLMLPGKLSPIRLGRQTSDGIHHAPWLKYLCFSRLLFVMTLI